MSNRPKIFCGWWVVAAASLGLFLSTGTIVVLAFGVFFKSLSQDFHASRSAVSLAFTLHNVIGALCAPLFGRMIDRVGARRVILIGTAMFALILLSCVVPVWPEDTNSGDPQARFWLVQRIVGEKGCSHQQSGRCHWRWQL